MKPGEPWTCDRCNTAGGRPRLVALIALIQPTRLHPRRFYRIGCTICRDLDPKEILTLKLKALYSEAYVNLVRAYANYAEWPVTAV